MLSPEYYEGCADDILKLYEQLEDDIISDVVRRIVKTGKVTETARHQIEQLQETGLLYDDILNTIAGQTDATGQQVRTLFEDAGVETVRIDNKVYRENGLTPVDIRQSPAMRQTLEAGYRKTLGNMKNLTLTTANTSQSSYINACNQAYMQITSGAFSYQEAIKQAIQKTAQNGATVTYPSGHTERIDVAVRRAVLTGVGQTCREIGIMNAEECGCDLMEISAHSGARPSHASWQGKIVSLSGRRGYLSLKDIGYGTGDGFGGWNCRHDWFPFFEGYSKPNYSAKDLKKLDEKNIEYNGKMYSQYEISQIQRRYEREIRAAKREQVAFRTAVEEADDPELRQVMQDSLNYSNSLVKDKQAKMRDFIKQTGQDRDYFREQNYGKVDYKKNSQNSLMSPTDNGKLNNMQNADYDNDGKEKFKNAISGKKYLNTLKEFSESLPNLSNQKVATMLQKAYDNVIFEKSKKKKSYFQRNENKIYLKNGATVSTLAHELFHKIDHDNSISTSGLLNKCIENDYVNLKNIAEKAGLSIGDMLYLTHPEAFKKKGRMKIEYSGVSDIINGMTGGEINLGYYHEDDYWKKTFKLQKETFAHYGRFYYDNNPDVLKLVNEILPETSKQVKMIVNLIK
ncbi:MAG: phage minor capsid protein [Ruminococcus sp.]|nr:phage minor capsid protein [Ruminococcus sp.]